MSVVRWLPLLLGLWQVSSPYALGFHTGLHTEGSLVLGVVTALAGSWGALTHQRWPYSVAALCGLATLALPFIQPGPHLADEVIVGVLVFLSALLQVAVRASHA